MRSCAPAQQYWLSSQSSQATSKVQGIDYHLVSTPHDWLVLFLLLPLKNLGSMLPFAGQISLNQDLERMRVTLGRLLLLAGSLKALRQEPPLSGATDNQCE